MGFVHYGSGLNGLEQRKTLVISGIVDMSIQYNCGSEY